MKGLREAAGSIMVSKGTKDLAFGSRKGNSEPLFAL